jgi:hypothetical protein
MLDRAVASYRLTGSRAHCSMGVLSGEPATQEAVEHGQPVGGFSGRHLTSACRL